MPAVAPYAGAPLRGGSPAPPALRRFHRCGTLCKDSAKGLPFFACYACIIPPARGKVKKAGEENVRKWQAIYWIFGFQIVKQRIIKPFPYAYFKTIAYFLNRNDTGISAFRI